MSRAAAASPQNELVLGRFRPLRPLGTGSSGSVWLARDEQTGLDLALKIVPRDGKAGSRAEREAAAASRLRHPSCLRAYGCGRDASHVYIAYEYAPGRTLREVMRAGELHDRAAIEAGAQILEGLAHAHERGIVHRDVKPANVLMLGGEEVAVRLLDFGLARMPAAETLTGRGDVPGTLAYISPERLAGEEAGPASDVWSVGVLLWEALAGRHPFWRPSPVETSRAIQAGAPPLRTARPDLPETLTSVVDSALAVVPAARPPAAKLAAAFRDASKPRARKRARTTRPVDAARAARVLDAALPALVAGWSASALPFFPEGFAPGLAVLAGALGFLRPRLGVAVALAVPVLPLGNISLGLAVLYTAVALGWLLACWTESRATLAAAAGPVLAPLSALALVPLALAPVRSPARRALQAAGAMLLAGIVAGIRGVSLPIAASPPPDLDIARSDSPLVVAGALIDVLSAHPVLAVEAAVVAAAAVALPFVARRGLWAIAAFGATLLAAVLLPAPHLAVLPTVACVWGLCLVLGRKAWR